MQFIRTNPTIPSNFIKMMELMVENSSGGPLKKHYNPPHNVENKGEGKYVVSMPVPGYSISELDIEYHDEELVVTGKKADGTPSTAFIRQGYSINGFTKSFCLEKYSKPKSATCENGILSILIEREVPESQRPKKVEIN